MYHRASDVILVKYNSRRTEVSFFSAAQGAIVACRTVAPEPLWSDMESQTFTEL